MLNDQGSSKVMWISLSRGLRTTNHDHEKSTTFSYNLWQQHVKRPLGPLHT